MSPGEPLNEKIGPSEFIAEVDLLGEGCMG